MLHVSTTDSFHVRVRVRCDVRIRLAAFMNDYQKQSNSTISLIINKCNYVFIPQPDSTMEFVSLQNQGANFSRFVVGTMICFKECYLV